jgi:hypothetical protein
MPRRAAMMYNYIHLSSVAFQHTNKGQRYQSEPVATQFEQKQSGDRSTLTSHSQWWKSLLMLAMK